MKEFKNVHILDHPLIRHKLAIIRDKNTNTKQFREIISELATLMAYESFKDVPTQEIEVETPLEVTKQTIVKENSIAIVPILRAGLGMVDGLLKLVPSARVGHIGLYRDPETHLPIEYYCKMPPDIAERHVFVVDPMLATGGSASAAIDFLKQRGCNSIKLMCLIGCPEGVKAVTEAHPDVDLYLAALDEKLNEHDYIVPGLGDAGDRIFGTK